MMRFLEMLARREADLSMADRCDRANAAGRAQDAQARIAERGFDYLTQREPRPRLRTLRYPQRHPSMLLLVALERAERLAAQMPLALAAPRSMEARQ